MFCLSIFIVTHTEPSRKGGLEIERKEGKKVGREEVGWLVFQDISAKALGKHQQLKLIKESFHCKIMYSSWSIQFQTAVVCLPYFFLKKPKNPKLPPHRKTTGKGSNPTFLFKGLSSIMSQFLGFVLDMSAK